MQLSDSSFIHQSLRTRVVAKPGAIAELASELQKLGCHRPMLLSSRRMAASAVYAELRQAAQAFKFFETSDIPQHSSIPKVQQIAREVREQGVDCLVAIGGGSVSDTAKAVALIVAEGDPLERHATRFIPPDTVLVPDLIQPKLPIVSIPMSASGAEVTPSLGIRTAEGSKLLFWDAQLASRVILLDPVANLIMPAAVMLATGMNGLAHCIEGLYSKSRSPVTTVLALEGIKRFDRALRQVARAPDQWEYRSEILLAAHISGMVLASARSCLHHAVCHVLGATYDVAHGAVNAVILPHAVAFNAPFVADELSAAARALDLPASGDDASAALVEWLRSLQKETGVPGTLRELGIDRATLKATAAKVMHERGLAYNPRPVTDAAEIESMLMAAW